jgi:hypothetical protein
MFVDPGSTPSIGKRLGSLLLILTASVAVLLGTLVVISIVSTREDFGAVAVAVGYEVAVVLTPAIIGAHFHRKGASIQGSASIAAICSIVVNLLLAPLAYGLLVM